MLLIDRFGSVRGYGTNRARTDRCAVGTAGPAAATPTSQDGPPTQRPPADRGGHRLDPADRLAVARPARPLRPLAHGVGPLLRLAPPGRLGSGAGGAADPGRPGRGAGLAAAPPGRQRGPRPPARRRGAPPSGPSRPKKGSHTRRMRHWAAAVAATPPSCTCASKAAASRGP